MKLGAKVKEQIARTIGDYFTTNGIVNVFKDAKITVQTELYAKWRMTLEAFNNAETEEAFYKIIEEFCHPLNFTDMQVRKNFVEALNNTLEIAEKCDLKLDLETTYLPDYPVPEGESLESYLEKLCREENIPMAHVAFVGDDLLDLPVLEKVGLAVAVANARAQVKAEAHYVTPNKGGEGAGRDAVRYTSADFRQRRGATR